MFLPLGVVLLFLSLLFYLQLDLSLLQFAVLDLVLVLSELLQRAQQVAEHPLASLKRKHNIYKSTYELLTKIIEIRVLRQDQ